MRTKWLQRSVAPAGPFLCLCLSEEEFRQAIAHLKATDSPKWVNSGAHATTHIFENSDGDSTCIVCLSEERHNRKPTQIAALLVHEAVHIWRHHCMKLGEQRPGEEQEAYGIQFISEHLMQEYARRCSTQS